MFELDIVHYVKDMNFNKLLSISQIKYEMKFLYLSLICMLYVCKL